MFALLSDKKQHIFEEFERYLKHNTDNTSSLDLFVFSVAFLLCYVL